MSVSELAAREVDLDPVSGKKVKGLDIPKRTLAITQLSGSVVSLNKSKEEKSKYLFAAEGVETALSIKNVLEKNKIANANVVATLGISNFSNLNRIGKPEEIVLVLDNDGANAASTKAAQKAINNLKDDGLKVSSIKPTEMLEGKKTDYNDLLQAGKMKQIEQDIKRIVDQKTNNISRPEKSSSTQNPEPAKADREII